MDQIEINGAYYNLHSKSKAELVALLEILNATESIPEALSRRKKAVKDAIRRLDNASK